MFNICRIELEVNKKSNLIYGFLACIFFDIASKNAWLLLDNYYLANSWKLRDKIYFSMQSFSFLCYLSYIYLFAAYIQLIPLRIIASNWWFFGAQDFYEEMTGRATLVQYTEYIALPVAIIIVLCEIYKFNPFRWLCLFIKCKLRLLYQRTKQIFLH